MSFAPTNFMFIPSAGCQAACSYCFGPNRGPVMLITVLEQALDFIEKVAPADTKLHFTFHGGEPLLAGHDWYRRALPLIRERFGRLARLAMQSNLWALDEAYVELLAQYNVQVSTSLDAFPEMCDAQRGPGYFERTFAGIGLLRKHGLRPHGICTVTPSFASRGREILQFFNTHDIPFALHGALPALHQPPNGHELPPEMLAELLLETLEAYKSDLSGGSIGTFNAMAKGCYDKQGCQCTFFDCLGTFAAIDPAGYVYACQRFCGLREYALGHVNDKPETVTTSAAYHKLAKLQQNMRKFCGDCGHKTYCGGCPYNALAAGQTADPYCAAYRKVFDKLSYDMALEMGQLMLGEIMPAQAPLLAMAGDKPHPYTVTARKHRRRKALEWGLTKAPEYFTKPVRNKVYLHATFNCPLRCSHCYADTGRRAMPEMPVDVVCSTVKEAQKLLFREVVVTGGEPLAHGAVDEMLEGLAEISLKGMGLVLRSSLGFELPAGRLRRAAEVFTEMVVSVDGAEEAHDARRGRGSYAKTLANLERLCEWGFVRKISLCATLTAKQRKNGEAAEVEVICKRLGIAKLNIKPVLPLGRAMAMPPDEALGCGGHSCARRANVTVLASCGLGQNLYIEPDGGVYPCYAWCGDDKRLGYLAEGLAAIVNGTAFTALSRYSVDDNEKCRSCEVRYLCGGMCKALVTDKHNLHSGAFDCPRRRVMLAKHIDYL